MLSDSVFLSSKLSVRQTLCHDTECFGCHSYVALGQPASEAELF